MTPERLREIEARHAATTGGTWYAHHYEGYGWRVDAGRQAGIASGQWHEGDADFIADAHQAIPELLTEVRRLTPKEGTPTVPGVYWHEDGGLLEIVDVRHALGPRGTSLFAFTLTMARPRRVDLMTGRWYGPLPEPIGAEGGV